jgi:hypothetical protein
MRNYQIITSTIQITPVFVSSCKCFFQKYVCVILHSSLKLQKVVSQVNLLIKSKWTYLNFNSPHALKGSNSSFKTK